MKNNSDDVLKYLITLLEFYLKELNGKETDIFLYGEKTAYVECLEIVQQWEGANDQGLNYKIEAQFPL